MNHNTTDRFDLHLHTHCSDGRLAPKQVLARCAAAGLHTVALTDHDVVGTLPPGVHTVGERTIRLIAGAELTGTHQGREYHLLVYFAQAAPEDFRALCAQQRKERVARYNAAVRSLGAPGLQPVCEAPQGDPRAYTRHHLARAMVSAGLAPHLRDAFDLLARENHVPPMRIAFEQCIARARACGGVTAWAHPPLPAITRWLPQFVQAGLQGIEGWRPFQSGRTTRQLSRLAKRHGLVRTGGSDWHGWKPTELGLFSVSRAQLQPFLATLAQD